MSSCVLPGLVKEPPEHSQGEDICELKGILTPFSSVTSSNFSAFFLLPQEDLDLHVHFWVPVL